MDTPELHRTALQVLIMPGTGCIVTAGDDSCVCAYPLPPGLASRCQLVRLAEQVRQCVHSRWCASVGCSAFQTPMLRLMPAHCFLN